MESRAKLPACSLKMSRASHSHIRSRWRPCEPVKVVVVENATQLLLMQYCLALVDSIGKMKLAKNEQSPSSVRQTIRQEKTSALIIAMHPNLVLLEELKPTLSYPGWQHDYKTEEKMHKIFPPESFAKCLFRLKEKQRMYEGNRSHERLVKLDKRKWSYPGWKEDFRQAEEYHVWNRKETTRSFEKVFKEMRQKQREFNKVTRAFAEQQQQGEPSISPQFQHTCTICMEAPRSHVFIPCGHLTACESCSIMAFKKRRCCPICRKSSSMVTKVFLS